MSEQVLIHCGSKVDFHKDMYKTLVLLRIQSFNNGPVFFIVEGLGSLTLAGDEDFQGRQRYFYEEHTCPTNFMPCEAIYTADNNDPHGVFDHVRTVWMTEDYVKAKENGDRKDEWLHKAFPEIRSASALIERNMDESSATKDRGLSEGRR